MSKMLSSWKEIAHFFGKGVRTVQRWEKTLDLPIHRPAGAPSNVVLARTSDLEEWMHRGPVARAVSEEEPAADASLSVSAGVTRLEDELVALASWAGIKSEPDTSLSIEHRLISMTALLEQVNKTLTSERIARAA